MTSHTRTGTRRRRHLITTAMAAVAAIAVGAFFLLRPPTTADFEITDQLGGNIFPSAILSVATSDALIVEPVDTPYVGNPKPALAIRLTSSRHRNTMVRVELDSTVFFARSVSTFVLPEPNTTYTIYPDVLWRYDALRNNTQAEPISVVAHVEVDGKTKGSRMRTFSVRSVNECLLGYQRQVGDGKLRFVSTRQFFAAYVNEEHPLIDKVLREALNTRIVRRFTGYQTGSEAAVDKQVYALWYVLQKRNMQYSSVSYSSLSSNVVYSQRVRTFEDVLETSQINCVDGSVLFASLLRAINITPVLVQTPGHMFVGYYNDSRQSSLTFLETTMIGDVDLDDYFPEEHLDSTMAGSTQAEMSRLTFEKSKEYAHSKFQANEAKVRANSSGYLFLEISKALRRRIQPIGR